VEFAGESKVEPEGTGEDNEKAEKKQRKTL